MSKLDGRNNLGLYAALIFFGIPAFWLLQKPTFDKETHWEFFDGSSCMLIGSNRGVNLSLYIRDKNIPRKTVTIKGVSRSIYDPWFIQVDRPSLFNDLINIHIRWRIKGYFYENTSDIKFVFVDFEKQKKTSIEGKMFFYDKKKAILSDETEKMVASLINNLIESDTITLRKKTDISSGVVEDNIGYWAILSKQNASVIANFKKCVAEKGWI